MTAQFAHRTAVPIDQSKGDISAIIGKFGGDLLDINEDVPGRAIIMFQSNHVTPRYLRVVLHHPVHNGTEAVRQQCRSKWRALFLNIKAKLVSIDEGIETFDEAFMAWIIGEDNKTLYEKAQELCLLPPPSEERAA